MVLMTCCNTRYATVAETVGHTCKDVVTVDSMVEILPSFTAEPDLVGMHVIVDSIRTDGIEVALPVDHPYVKNNTDGYAILYHGEYRAI